jgi:sigma-B regulation protein RsbU (phosphoserine phosphatase)
VAEESIQTLQELAEENRRLRRSILELSILNEIALAIGTSQTLDTIIDLIVRKCVKHFGVEQGAVLIFGKKERKEQLHTLIRRADRTLSRLPYRLDDQLTGWMLKNRCPLRINHFREDKRFNIGRSADVAIRSLLAVPMMVKQQMIGVVVLFNKRDEDGFTPDDQRLLTILASESAQLIENARLYREEQEYLRVQEEIRVASQIQRGLLPRKIPSIEGYEMCAVNFPAQAVSGDYYDFLIKPEGRVCFCLADVSGKGIPAALLMASLQATLRAQVIQRRRVKNCVRDVNRALFASTSSEKYATLFFGELDFLKHKLTFCNAGHNPPLFFSRERKQFVRLETGGTVIGFLEDPVFQEEVIHFRKGDLLVVFSDGITEALNSDGDEFGEQALQEVVSGAYRESAEGVKDRILEKVKEFTEGNPQSDDMTLLVIKRC